MVTALQPVASSNISGVGYDAQNSLMTVRFINGGEYQYFNVPQDVYDDLMQSASPGTFFSQNVKGIYEYQRIG